MVLVFEVDMSSCGNRKGMVWTMVINIEGDIESVLVDVTVGQ